jgi:hypothetical protein
MADRHCRAGGAVWMGTFTLRHDRWQKAAELRRAITKAWSKMVAGNPWLRAKAAAHLAGWARALEVTHGKANGWHPHIHAVFFLDAGGDEEVFGEWLFDRWCNVVERLGLGSCNRDLWRWERAASLDAAVNYVVKGNFDQELTRGHMKRAKGDNRTPWQLLEASAAGNRRAAALFREYARVFKGARQVTYSHGFKSASDEELAAEIESGPIVCHIWAQHWFRIVDRGLRIGVLEAAEDAGALGVKAFFKAHGITGGVYEPKSPNDEVGADGTNGSPLSEGHHK